MNRSYTGVGASNLRSPRVCVRDPCQFFTNLPGWPPKRINRDFFFFSGTTVSEFIALNAAMARNLWQGDIPSRSSDLFMNGKMFLYRLNAVIRYSIFHLSSK